MPPVAPVYDGFLPGRHAIEAYGQGGFRFGGMSHRGSLLFLPGGVHRWDVDGAAGLKREHFESAILAAQEIDIMLIGLGASVAAIDPQLRLWLKEQGLRVDVMTTASAAMTYNVLLAEDRRVAAGLIATDLRKIV